MLDPAVFKAIADYGLAIVALVLVTGFAFWIIRRLIALYDSAIARLVAENTELRADNRSASRELTRLADAFENLAARRR